MALTKNDAEPKIATDNGNETHHTWEQGPRKISPTDGKFVDLRAVGIRYLAWDHQTAGLLSIVEHPVPPKTLVAPLHKHTNEDEYSFIIEGRMGAMLGNNVVYAEAGELVFKPRNQWHTFWNDSDTVCRILEIIAPGGFEHFFDEVHGLMAAMNAQSVEEISGPGMPGADLAAKYGLEFKPESVEILCAKYGLVYPGNKMFGSRKE